jgi:hypothetical protein
MQFLSRLFEFMREQHDQCLLNTTTLNYTKCYSQFRLACFEPSDWTACTVRTLAVQQQLAHVYTHRCAVMLTVVSLTVLPVYCDQL